MNKNDTDEIIERLNDRSVPVEVDEKFWEEALKDSEDRENN